MSNETEIRSFQIDMPEEAIADLRRRITATRWPSQELVADRSQGVQLATLQELARYWAADYDWRKCEARLNALPQCKTQTDGVGIHFIHVRSPHEDALPLIMTHGWPGSVIELLETVGPLTDPTAHGGAAADAFHLVLPSIPGYGFSAQPTELGWHAGRTAQAWATLMDRLGYTRYVAQGGDQGAAVTDAMGRRPLLLGGRTSPSARGLPASSAGPGPGRVHHVPGRDLPGPAQLGRGVLPHPHLFPRGRPGRPLRRLGRARCVHNRGPGGVQAAGLTTARTKVTVTPSSTTKANGRAQERWLGLDPGDSPLSERVRQPQA